MSAPKHQLLQVDTCFERICKLPSRDLLNKNEMRCDPFACVYGMEQVRRILRRVFEANWFMCVIGKTEETLVLPYFVRGIDSFTLA